MPYVSSASDYPRHLLQTCGKARPLTAWCCLGVGVIHLLMVPEYFLGAGVVHLLMGPEHFREWWGYGWICLALAAFHSLYGLRLAEPAGPLPRRRAYLLTGVSANLLVLGPSVAILDRAIPPLAPRTGELKPPSSAVGHHAQGLPLSADAGRESVTQGGRCLPSAPLREYRVAVINAEITLNRFLDYDPKGRMYVLEAEVERVRQEEARNREASAGTRDPAISIGLQGDAIQPLTLRVNQGECLRVALRNALDNDEPASFHLHGASLYVTATGAPALAANPDATASPGASVTYEWWVSDNEPEGTRYFHSHGNTRLQTAHGLFGAVIVEPRGSRHLDPITGEPLASGWAAIIQDPRGPAFREFALYYHEVGNERYRHLDRLGAPVVQVDPYTSAYRPGDRAMNYRSEPFMNRLGLQRQTVGRFDKSAAYSSYGFGDPATPIARSYLGDPVKQRVVHGGSEVFTCIHVHGGSIRWRRQPGVEPTGFNRGLDKRPPLLPQATERIDSQAIGPSETYDVEHECGSGGCQQGAGDYLVHCHVAHHYIAGMWMIWRVYNTRQDGALTLDSLPPLAELPDRTGQMEHGVTSQELVGRSVDWKGKSFEITQENLEAWVERQLPPRGVPRCLVPGCDGVKYQDLPSREALWDNYSTGAPARQRRCVARSNIVKKV
jgi:FtsP/CotA-like multicopper oxidase with cupredoxin domain